MSNFHLDNQSKQLQEAFNEISNLRCKLDSKSRASVILSQDLLECKRERDEYKLMHDQIKERYSALKRRIEGSGANFMGINEDPNNLTSASFAQILCKLNKQNKMLLYELEEVKTKLIDAEGDVRLLRGQINSIKRRPGLTNMHSSSIISNSSSVGSSSSSCTASSTIKECPDEINTKNGSNSVNEGCNALQGMSSGSSTAITTLSSSQGRQKDEKQALVAQLEMIKQRNSLMEKDMKSLLDEKEELIMIRDAYKAKVERLNGRLNNLLREQSDDPTNETNETNDTKTIDIDSLINENNFLREKMSQLEEEKKRLKTLCTKYRNILERSTPSTSSSMFSSLKSSSDSRSKLLADSQVLSNNVISSKQVQAFIASNNLNNLQLSQATLVNLKSLVIALFESLTDKSSALALQRKNNRLLGERLEELEEKIKQLKAREKVFFLMKDNVKAELYHQEDLEDDLILHPREGSTRFTPLPLTSQNDNDNTSCNNNNDSNDNENDPDSKIINEEFESLAGESDDEIQLPSNLKALVDGEVLKLKQNDDCRLKHRNIASP